MDTIYGWMCIVAYGAIMVAIIAAAVVLDKQDGTLGKD